MPSQTPSYRSRTRPAFSCEGRVAREDPAAVAPGPNGVLGQPAPERGLADGRDEPAAQDLALDLGDAEARQREAVLVGQLTGQRLNRDDDAGGKSGPAARAEAALPGRPSRSSKKRLRHLLTIWRGVSRRAAI